jgi:phosphoadenosine phosphosulfate reductase
MERMIEELNEKLKGNSAEQVLRYFLDKYGGKITLGTSLGAEDQVITDMLVNLGGSYSIFTLDTGRLFPETYAIIDKTRKHYGIAINVFFPDPEHIEKMVNEKGVNLFYDSIENRKQCCFLRKIEPLKRALPGNEVWITGLRKDQSLTRFYTQLVEWDETFKIIKVNPLLNWTEKEVWKYIQEHDVPYNELHDKGFPSIGCQPCTRAVQPGEDFRAGRWWWESPEHNECGLHVKDETKET